MDEVNVDKEAKEEFEALIAVLIIALIGVLCLSLIDFWNGMCL